MMGKNRKRGSERDRGGKRGEMRKGRRKEKKGKRRKEEKMKAEE